MVSGAAAVEDDLLDPFGQGGLRCQGADALCAHGVSCQFVAIGCRLAGRGSRGQGDTCPVINELDMDISVAKEDAHARAFFSAADLLAHAPMASYGQVLCLFCSHRKSLRLPFDSSFSAL